MQINAGSSVSLLVAMAPELVIVAASLVVLLVNAWRHDDASDSRLAGWISLVGILAAIAVTVGLWRSGVLYSGVSSMMAMDSYRFAAVALILVASGGSVLLSLGYLERERMIAPEYYALLLMATSGAMFLAGADDLIVLFLGLEVMSVPVYVLAGFNRRNVLSAEAAIKYFLVGAVASAFLLYGIALVYGGTGATSLFAAGTDIAGRGLTVMTGLGLGLLLIGLGFKIASVPFHMWAPDVYDGAPTPVTAYMATVVKVAAFVALVRILYVGFGSASATWAPIVGALAIGSMVVGNLIALAQRSLKRMLAYSSVAHAGYLLVAVAAGSRGGAGAVLLYLAAYAVTILATFGMIAWLGRGGEREVSLDTIAGLSRRQPWVAFGLTVCMFSLLGFPGTFGFMGKWAIVQAAVAARGEWLAVVLVITSLVSAGYYLPVVRAIYMRSEVPRPNEIREPVPGTVDFAVTAAVALILIFGLVPHGALTAAETGARSLAGMMVRKVATVNQ